MEIKRIEIDESWEAWLSCDNCSRNLRKGEIVYMIEFSDLNAPRIFLCDKCFETLKEKLKEVIE